MPRFLISLAALCLISLASAQAPKFKKVLPETPLGFTLKTLTVEEHPEHTVELFVYVPDADGTYPCILDIHGGGWRSRQVESDKPMMERLAQRGFVTALVSYRLSGEAPYPAALYDCKAALRTLRAHADELKIIPDRIGCMGGSAGGHLSGLVSMTTGKKEFEGNGPHQDQSSAVKAAIVMAATQDLVTAYGAKPSEGVIAFLGSYEEHPEHYRDASPITHVRKGVPPTIFIEGEKDTLKIGRTEMMTKLKELKIETAVHTLKDAPHPFWMSQPWLDQTVEIADKFFKKHLGKPKPAAYTSVEDARAKGPDFDVQGEFTAEHDGKRWGVQVWAMGGGQFEAVGYQGGLPGDGWDLDRDTISRTPGTWDEALGKAVFVAENNKLRAEVGADIAEVFDGEGTRLFELQRVHRESPTLGAEPPEGALVLFNGSDINRFPGSTVTEEGWLKEGILSEPKFEDFTIHIEFRLPYMPSARGQARGNSGIYLQGRYEVQMLDSFALEGVDNECGGIYKTARPNENMCFPPLAWQTYDIDFTAARFDGSGNKSANAKITVRHNGVVIHEDLEIPEPTGGAREKGEQGPGPIFLQNHGNPVRYRNIWVVEK